MNFGKSFCMNALFVAVIVIGGCASPEFQTNRTVFHSLPESTQGKTIAIVGYPEERNHSLEFRSYKLLIEQKFRTFGFSVREKVDDAEYVALISYGIDAGTTTTQTGSVPMYGQTGGGSTYHSGTVNTYGSGGYGYGSYSGTSYTMPTYGIVGSQSYSYNITTYNRNLAMDIVRTKTLNSKYPEKIYEARLTSKGICGQILQVMDEFIEALFEGFPGKSGEAKNIVISGEKVKFDC